MRSAACRRSVSFTMLYLSKMLRVVVTAHLHRHPLRDTGADHVTDSGTAQVVEQSPRQPGRLARLPPGLLEVVVKRQSVAVEYESAAKSPAAPAPLDHVEKRPDNTSTRPPASHSLPAAGG